MIAMKVIGKQLGNSHPDYQLAEVSPAEEPTDDTMTSATPQSADHQIHQHQIHRRTLRHLLCRL